MIDSTSYVIYYIPGAYGTFVEWCLNFFTDAEFNKELPFTANGSAHKFLKSLVFTHRSFDDLFNKGPYNRSIRMHPGVVFGEIYNRGEIDSIDYVVCMKNELEYLYNNYTKKIVVLYYNTDSELTGLNNVLVKSSFLENTDGSSTAKKETNAWFDEVDANDVLREMYFDFDLDNKIRRQLIKYGANIHASAWGHTDLTNLKRWELREFLSLYCGEISKTTNQSYYDKLQLMFNDILFVEISDLESNFTQIIPKIIEKFNLPYANQDQLDHVYTSWISRQSFANRNKLVKKIVDCTIANEYFDFGDILLTLYDEAFIQKLLRDQNLELQCYNLDIFPTNTLELRKIISE